MSIEIIALVALAILLYGAVSARLQQTIITPPMVFTLLGILFASDYLALLTLDTETAGIHLLAEFTLVLLLFTDASRIDLRQLRREHTVPVRLLAIGMPLTILTGLPLALMIFSDIGIWNALVLAVILTPTDAALGQAVVSSSKVPVRIRQALNVESGLNDGIALPILLITLSIACATTGMQSTGYWIEFVARQVVLGPLVGIAIGYGGGKLVELSTRKGWMDGSFQRLSAIGLALLAFTVAELPFIHGNGFIAAFCAGMTLGNTARAVCSCLFEFGEAEGQLLTLIVFLIFGAAMAPDALLYLGWETLLYAIVCLTVMRMLPVSLSLLGAGLRWETHLFLGWFGPRGIASLLFILLVLEESALPGADRILAIVGLTVLLSIFAHGMTAVPATGWYARRMDRHRQETSMPEHKTVGEMPVRISHKSH